MWEGLSSTTTWMIWRRTEQLFVGFGNRAKGGPVTKKDISRWLVDGITLAYSSLGLQFYNLDVPALQARVLSA